MPRYSKESLEKLDTCNTRLIAIFLEVINHFDCSILYGHRGQIDQDEMFSKGKSRCKWPDSKHNFDPSLAIDAAPYYEEAPHIRWDKSSLYRWYFFGGLVIAISKKMMIPLRWGGDWDGDTYVKDQKWNDLPHFELII